MRGVDALLLASLLAGCGAKSGLADGLFPGRDAGASTDAEVPEPPDAGNDLACDGWPLPRPGAVTEWPGTGRSQGLAMGISDPPGVLIIGGLLDGGESAEQMAFLDLGLGVLQELPVEVERDPVSLPQGSGAAVYIPTTDSVVVMGGTIGREQSPTDQVFSFEGQGDTGGPRYVRAKLLPPLPQGPIGGLGAIYDPLAGRVIVHGGSGVPEDFVYRTTWALPMDDPREWGGVLPPEAGPPPGTRAMGYDPVGHRAIEITDDEDGEGLAVYALTLAVGAERWDRLGSIDFSPSLTGELVWDDRVCGFHLLSARRTRCVLEHWILTAEGDRIQTIYRGDIHLDPGAFLGTARFFPTRSSLLIHSAEDCRVPGTFTPMAATHEVALVR